MAPVRTPGVLLALAVVAVTALALAHAAEIRTRAEAALERGMPAREAALARGFVLGQDERIDSRTREDFRRAGLGHLLAVSGQNVTLLALLAMPVLAAFGLPLRARLVWTIGLIALYVPLAGAGPSIQRAGIMGALGAIATLAGRRSSRLQALVLAAIATLAVQPGIAADVGWQLSFAAVLGILLLAAPLRAAVVARIGSGAGGRLLAEGAAMTVAATLATAPLIAFHFGELSIVALAANLLALPAVAPAMWLGMLAAAGGQVPGFPVEAFNALDAVLLAYIAQVAAWCGRPGWASVHVSLGGGELAVAYVALLAAGFGASRLRRRRRGPSADGPKTALYRRRSARRRGVATAAAAAAAVLCALAFLWAAIGGGGGAAAAPRSGLRVSVLDVGQGDAILLQPPRTEAVLVDTGPSGADLVPQLRAAGVGRLGAVVLTHDEADHAGGLAELLEAVPVGRLLHGTLGRRTLAVATAARLESGRVAAGDEIRSGALRMQVLWPPAELVAAGVDGRDPNGLAVVLLLRWRHFTMLLGADAEAEAIPLDPGPLDALKVAHHGSADAGLGALLDRSRPRVAIVSAGDGNPFGHPVPATLATLAGHGVRTWRTDRDGTVVLQVGRRSFQIGGADD